MYKETDLYTQNFWEDYVYDTVRQPAYESATVSYKNGLRGLLKGEPDTLAARELLFLQMRSAHAIRNNGVAKAARDRYVTKLGNICVNWKTPDGKSHKVMQKLWDEFAANPNLDGHGNFANTQSVWHGSMFQSGNAFTRLQIRRKDNPNVIPLKLELITPEFHDVLFFGTSSGDKNTYTRHGIKFVDSKPDTYYFRKGIWQSFYMNEIVNPYTRIEVPANELLHMFIRDMPGQWIGIPSLTSVLIPLYELDELTDATVAKQKAAQAIAWVITNTNPIAMTPTGTPTAVKTKNLEDKIVFETGGGNTQYLNKGEDIRFYQGTDIGANLQILIQKELQRIASAVGIPYHELTGDTNGLDFSSIRAVAIELRTRIEYIHHFYTIPLGLEPLTAYFKELAVMYKKGVANAIPTFQLPRVYGVDELKDTQADLLEVQYGMATLQSKLDERHTTYEEILEDAKKRQELKEYGVDFTPSKTATAQSKNNQANSNSSSN